MWWKDLWKEGGKDASESILKYISHRLRLCRSIPFWTIRWVGQHTFASLYPNLFQLRDIKVGSVLEMGEWQEDMWKWKLNWTISSFDNQTQDDIDDMLLLLEDISLRINVKDGIV